MNGGLSNISTVSKYVLKGFILVVSTAPNNFIVEYLFNIYTIFFLIFDRYKIPKNMV